MENSGVSELKIAEAEMSICVSAIYYKNAGKKLPSKPESMISGILLPGVSLNAFTEKGSNTMPALAIRMDATW